MVAPLFGYLYLTLAGTSSMFVIALLILSQTVEKQAMTLTICLEQEVTPMPLQTFMIGRALLIGSTVLISILYFASMFYVKATSKSKNPPTIFGHYLRNVLTFKQTVLFQIFNFILYIVGRSIIFSAENYFKLEKHELKNVQFLVHFVLSLKSLILVLYLHYRLSKFITTTQERSKVFYIRTPEIIPKRDTLEVNYDNPANGGRHQSHTVAINIHSDSESSAKITSFRQAKVIFVKPKPRFSNVQDV